MDPQVRLVEPQSFEEKEHFYERVLNAQIHSLVRHFLNLGNTRIASRYCHLHPEVDPESVIQILTNETKHFRWGGADLLYVAADDGSRRYVVVETNSCPSGQKSMPRLQEDKEQAGYAQLLRTAFLPYLGRRSLPKGGLAVIYDKNPMEASGYAAVLADLTNESVWLVPMPASADEPLARFSDEGVLEIRSATDSDSPWQPIRAAVRYVTQRPWSRIPPLSKTFVFNPVLVCLAGGRNKLLAAKAYDLFNTRIEEKGLRLNTPETMWDVGLEEVPLWVARMGGYAVVKNPYTNAGQGVYTITNDAELEAFMAEEHRYDRFIVQGLIGHPQWSSRGRLGRLYHVGLIPDRKLRIYVADVRFMVGCGPDGFAPIAIYARRAREPLTAVPPEGTKSWDSLGTNLSLKMGADQWSSDTGRLMLMDQRDFNKLGAGIDDLIEAYMQTVMAVTSIDQMAAGLVNKKGRFRRKLFRSLNPDPTLVGELLDVRRP